MKESGCEYIFYGVETGDLKVKKYLFKNIDNEIIIKVNNQEYYNHDIGDEYEYEEWKWM